MVATRHMTIEEFSAVTPADGRFELIKGELREVAAASGRHGEIGSESHVRIGSFAALHGLGRTYTSETGFILARGDRAVVILPNVSFVRRERLPPAKDREGYMPVIPDLVVEVVSPTDRHADIIEKIALYMAAGIPMLWLAEPRRQAVTVHRPGMPPVVVELDGVLDGGNILPGLRIRVADVFAE